VLAPGGTAAIAGIADEPASISTYELLVGRETAVVGVSDHTYGELEYLLQLAAAGRLNLDTVVTKAVPLDARAINAALDSLEGFGPGVRTVIHPEQ
jgi:D-arabinose 1-dehydrogenase-like Zn-dependent alcohol dehydrogenase